MMLLGMVLLIGLVVGWIMDSVASVVDKFDGCTDSLVFRGIVK